MAPPKKEEFKVLSSRDHTRLRIGLYLGSASLETLERYIGGKKRQVKIVPAIVKAVDEIIDNSVDEAIRTNFKYANRIDVQITDISISVSDNGRGIPIEDVEVEGRGKLPRPVVAWTTNNAGTSFSEDRVTIGTNGVGSSVVNYISTRFIGSTVDGKNRLVMECSDGSNKMDFNVEPSKDKRGTQVTFEPDMSLFAGADSLTDIGLIEITRERLASLSVCFPKIKFTLNDEVVSLNMLTYSYGYLEPDHSEVVKFDSPTLSLSFMHSANGFQHNSFVNGVNTRQGGTYLDMVMGNIVEHLHDEIKAKHKLEISRPLIRNGLTALMFVRGFEDPAFDSQTKERLTNGSSHVREHWQAAGLPSYKDIALKIFKTPEIIEPIIAFQLHKKQLEEAAALKKKQKALKKVTVLGHVAASGPDAVLHLCEGESAMGFAVDVRDPERHGLYPLKGVALNTHNLTPAKVLKNTELSEVVTILGLDLYDPDSVDNMTYSRIAFMTDADHDGQHIAILLLGFFHKFWPRLLAEERIVLLAAPILISTKGKEERWFYDYESANLHKNKTSGWHHRYLKGLASLTKDEYSKIMNDPVYEVVEMDNPDMLELVLGTSADRRKTWIQEGKV